MSIKIKKNGGWVIQTGNVVQIYDDGSDIEVDTTLTKSDMAADAKTVGDAISDINDAIGDINAILDMVNGVSV